MPLKTLSVIGKIIIAVLLGTFRSFFLSFDSLLIPQTHLKCFFFLFFIAYRFASSVKHFFLIWFVQMYLLCSSIWLGCNLKHFVLSFPICDHYSSNNLMIIYNCCCGRCRILSFRCSIFELSYIGHFDDIILLSWRNYCIKQPNLCPRDILSIYLDSVFTLLFLITYNFLYN